MSAPRRVAIVRALGGLGDVLCVVPALRRIRAAEPEAEITYIGMEAVRGVVARYPDLVDRFLAFPSFPGIPELPFDAARLRDFLDARASEPQIDLAIQLHGSGSASNIFTGLLGARTMAGWHVPGLWRPDALSFPPFPDALSEVDRWLALAEQLGFAEGSERPDFPVSAAEHAALDAEAPGLAHAPFAIVHAGASDPRRRWPIDSFAAVADRLSRSGLRVVLTGTPNEAAIAGDLEAAMHTPALNLCGRTTLGTMGALIERARLVVTNDTGTSHLCAALRTRSVTIFIASDPARWAPGDTARHLAVGTGVADTPVGMAPKPVTVRHPPVAAVLEAVETLLEYA